VPATTKGKQGLFEAGTSWCPLPAQPHHAAEQVRRKSAKLPMHYVRAQRQHHHHWTARQWIHLLLEVMGFVCLEISIVLAPAQTESLDDARCPGPRSATDRQSRRCLCR
jgi:hypothetical protein